MCEDALQHALIAFRESACLVCCLLGADRATCTAALPSPTSGPIILTLIHTAAGIVVISGLAKLLPRMYWRRSVFPSGAQSAGHFGSGLCYSLARADGEASSYEIVV